MFRHTHRVTYAECTVGNHVYHSRYLDWLEAARGEFIRSLGQTVLQWQERGTIFPVIEARLRYKLPPRYDDVLAIEVWPTLIERVRSNSATASPTSTAKSSSKPKPSTPAPALTKSRSGCRRNWRKS